MPLEDGGVAMPHNEVGLHKGSFAPQDELRSQVEFCKMIKINQRNYTQMKPK